MSYDYEIYDGKRINVDGEVIGLLAMEFGREVEEVWKEYHAELAMTEEQERQSEAYKESLRRTLSAQYKKVATLEAENAKLRNEVDNLLDFEHLTSVAVDYAGCDECGEYKQTMLRLFAENDKLRELARLLLYGATHDAEPSEGLVWSQKVNVLMRELGIEV